MVSDNMQSTFVTYAADILGDTEKGFTGSKIVQITVSHAVEFDVQVPHPTYPFSKVGVNKRTALFQNLMPFSSKQRYKIIKEMCEHPYIQAHNKEEAQKLKIKLFSKYGQLDDDNDADGLNENLIEETRHWLEQYPEALELFNSALQKQENKVFLRNLLDDLRLALEKLLCSIFKNQKSLENQLQLLGKFLNSKGGSPELTNMFYKLIEYYTKYQNSYVKHDDAVLEEEIDFIFEITTSFMKHLVKLNLSNQS